MKKAFTLIELLVVIAIIAILAAILFPVFAQAKLAAKKSVALSQAKQLGTAVNIYLADSDDMMPLGYCMRENGSYFWGATPFPADSVTTAPWDTAFRRSQAQTMWANSVQPYTKSYDIFANQAAKTVQLSPADTFTPGAQKTAPNLTLNGLVSGISATEVVAPSSAILLWSGRGNHATQNRAYSIPYLLCAATGTAGQPAPACRFNASGPPQTGTSGTLDGLQGTAGMSAWTFEKQAVYIRCDSSAKVQRTANRTSSPLTAPTEPATIAAALTDPYFMTGPNGNVDSFYRIRCNTDGVNNYWCFFRPDRDQ